MVFDIATLDGLAADIGAPVPNGDPAALTSNRPLSGT